jgi:hypothetical protein
MYALSRARAKVLICFSISLIVGCVFTYAPKLRVALKHEDPAEGNDVNTIVTAYFDTKSKHSSAEYKQWMSNMLSLQDGMVIFTTPDMVSMITQLRKHALHLTKVVPTDLHQLRMATAYDEAFWKRQHSLDPESGIHESYQLYWIWDEKTEFLKRAVDMNPFNSSFFAWVDIGYFRETKFNGQNMLKRIPSDLGESQMLMLDVNPLMIGAPGYDPKHGKYIGGGFIGGYETGIRKWHSEFYAMLERHKDTFIGKDQPIMWKTCEANPGLCKLVVPDSTGEYGDPWFYMAPYLILLTK